MVIVRKRKIVKTGTSFTITLPPEFVRKHGLNLGDDVAVVSGEWLHVMPFKRIDKKAKRRRQ